MCVCVCVPVGRGGVRLETGPDVSVLPGSQPRGYQGNNVNIVCDAETFLLLILPPPLWCRSAAAVAPLCQAVCYPGSTWIFSASRDKTALMWDLNQGDEPIQEFCGHELVVNGLAISPGTHTGILLTHH